MKYTLHVASDIVRDGIGLELEDASGQIVAEVFRSDRDHTVVINTFGHSIPVETMTWFLESARVELDPFEDGTPLCEATKWPFQSSASN